MIRYPGVPSERVHIPIRKPGSATEDPLGLAEGPAPARCGSAPTPLGEGSGAEKLVAGATEVVGPAPRNRPATPPASTPQTAVKAARERASRRRVVRCAPRCRISAAAGPFALAA